MLALQLSQHMKMFRKILRIIGLVLIILLAGIGVGLFGGVLPNNRERYMDNEIKIEMVDKKREEKKSTELGEKT